MINLTFLKYFKKSVTLIELIAVITVLGIASTSLMALLAEVTRKVRFSEDTISASFYAGQLMERKLAEASANRTLIEQEISNGTANWSVSALASGDGFSKSVGVAYGNVSGSNWTTSLGPTAFIILNVTVSKPGSGSRETLATVI